MDTQLCGCASTSLFRFSALVSPPSFSPWPSCCGDAFHSHAALSTSDSLLCLGRSVGTLTSSTHTAASGLKTRDLAAITEEITACLRIHTECNSRMGGISLEFTGELNDEEYRVTECVGGSMQTSEEELGLRYQSFCNPRLNFEQSLGGCLSFEVDYDADDHQPVQMSHS